VNTLRAKVLKIENKDSLNLVTFSFKSINLFMISLDLNEQIKENAKVVVYVKPTNISLAKEFEGQISSSNKLKGQIISIEKGQLLSSVICNVLDIQIQSMITTNSLNNMNLCVHDNITLFFKASDLSIREIINV